MSKLLLSAFAACFATAAPTALWAQENPEHHPAGEHPAPMSGPSHPAPERMPSTPTFRQGTGHPPTTYHRTYTGSSTYHHTTTTSTSHGVRETTHMKVDRSSFHRNVEAERRFRYGDYHAPAGYEYRRWSFGDRLPGIYYGRDYWITNYLNFGLPWAPDDCAWVRYGPDALLVDLDTGEILEVVYGVFY
jgi:Ni/Co efflux regulator RcnB